MALAAAPTGYAPVDGHEVYYEIHGSGNPVVLLHGALSATGTSFGAMLPALATSRRVISIEQQAHGHTADFDRPMTISAMAADTLAVLDHLGIDRADLFGYSMGAGIASEIAVRHPDRVRKVVMVSVSFHKNGLHPGLLDGLDGLQPEQLEGTPWLDEYRRIAPRPEDFPRLVERVKQMNRSLPEFSADEIRSIQAPVLLIIGDSDIVTPEHSVEAFRLLGGGVIGDLAGIPASELAILPATPHSTIMTQAHLIAPMVQAFLDRPMPTPD
jgi:pimeloyl-ACP methyl ester carboxylesterase